MISFEVFQAVSFTLTASLFLYMTGRLFFWALRYVTRARPKRR